MMTRRMTNRDAGFTLVELLVVCAIISLLLTLLMPTLAGARHRARLTVCATNVRTYNNSLATYATEWSDAIPLVFYSGTDTSGTTTTVTVTSKSCDVSSFCVNSGVYWTDHNSGLGGGTATAPLRTFMAQALQDSNLLTDLKPFYCPVLAGSGYNKVSRYQYNNRNPDSTNAETAPWPFQAFKYTRVSYMFRPMMRGNLYGSALAVDAPSGSAQWNYIAVTTSANVNTGNSGFTKTVNLLPRNAIVADLTPALLNATLGNANAFGHIMEGANVAYFDGSVEWVPYKAYSGSYSQGATNTTLNYSTYNAGTGTFSGVFPDFDRYH